MKASRNPGEAHVLRASERAAAPWKNGGGVTYEIAAFPQGAGMDDFLWRVSLAEVDADGPFSSFAGIDRTLTMVEGAGMQLTLGEGQLRIDTPYVPHDLPGDVPTSCRLLGGRVVNFNVMWRRGRVPVSVAVVGGQRSLRVPAGGRLLVVAFDGAAVDGVGLGRYDAVLLTGGQGELSTAGRVAVVAVGA